MVNKFSHARLSQWGTRPTRTSVLPRVLWTTSHVGLAHFLRQHPPHNSTDQGMVRSHRFPSKSSHGWFERRCGAAVALAERATLLASIMKVSNQWNIHPRAKSPAEFARFQIDAPSCDNCGSILSAMETATCATTVATAWAATGQTKTFAGHSNPNDLTNGFSDGKVKSHSSLRYSAGSCFRITPTFPV